LKTTVSDPVDFLDNRDFFLLKTCASFVPHREFKLGQRRSPEACLLEMW
jgi:hypothetical protein